jgi:hypothetical protein
MTDDIFIHLSIPIHSNVSCLLYIIDIKLNIDYDSIVWDIQDTDAMMESPMDLEGLPCVTVKNTTIELKSDGSEGEYLIVLIYITTELF